MDGIHDPARLIAFVTFSAVVAGTPGPSNALLAAAGATVGVRRGLPSLLGQVTGMGAMLFAITLGLGGVLLAHPLAIQVLRWGGAAVLCWIAWRMATAGHAGQATKAPAGFLGMAAFQWVNPKGWLVGIAAIATFLGGRADGVLAQAVLFATVFTLVALPACLPWLAFGAAIQRFLRSARAWRVFNAAMAGLLAASTILLVWTRF
ncbi:MAG TPA: LysE family translocator [Streptosporangiaceae bacterium]|nr:LysE family translocator [Streptosporangiaceae bacterium]